VGQFWRAPKLRAVSHRRCGRVERRLKDSRNPNVKGSSNIDWEIDELCTLAFAVIGAYYSALLPVCRACLAVVASLALMGRTLPLCVILEGPSGYGKTAVLNMFLSLALAIYIYRSDKFTPKAFVTHASNVKKADLKSIDLLPKLVGKTLITKELAPMFRGREDALTEIFSFLCSVLDGKGLTTDSGTQGQRGYQEAHVFNWLGATTPVPAETHSLMYQLGTRLLFYEMPVEQIEEKDLFAYFKGDRCKEAEEQTRKAVKMLLVEFFKQHPVSSVEPDSITIPDTLGLEIVRWSQLLAAGRAKLKRETQNSMGGSSSRAIAAYPPEAPYKIVDYLKQFARGSALIMGRTEVDSTDIELVAHVAISSIPIHYRPVIRQLRRSRIVTSSEAAIVCEVSSPTARKYLYELSLLGFGELKKGHAASKEEGEEEPDELTRAAKYEWITGLALVEKRKGKCTV
jgi:hypothetical protein